MAESGYRHLRLAETADGVPTVELARPEALNALNTAMGEDLLACEPEADWYGRDAIHLRRSRQPAVWRDLLSRWTAAPPTSAAPPGGVVSRRGLAPEWRTVAGVSLRRAQPSGVLGDGTTVSLY